MTFNINITKRLRRRKLRNGTVVTYTRFVLNYRHPATGQRRQEFFERAKDAQGRKRRARRAGRDRHLCRRADRADDRGRS